MSRGCIILVEQYILAKYLLGGSFMKRILLPVDGSPGCQKAFDMAENLAKKYDGTVTVLYVYDMAKLPYEVEFSSYIDKFNKTDANEKMLQDIVELFKSDGIKANSILLKGDPASEIIDESETGKYDVVIMCTHGMSTGKRFLMGSVTNKVIHHIKIPILVVR